MKSLVLSNYDMPWLPSLVLLLFITIFVGMLLIVFRKGSKQRYQLIAGQVLTDGERHGK